MIEETAPKITYIADLDFHKRVDDMLKGIMDVTPDSDRLGVDQALTEGLLAEWTWPASWAALTPDHDKAFLIQRIIKERGVRL